MASGPHQPIRLFVIEDDKDDLLLIKESLRHLDYPVVMQSTHDGTSAREILQSKSQNPPDLIFLDLNLPGVDGRDLLTLLRNDPTLSSTPIVILTGAKDRDAGAYAWSKDDILYFEKPPTQSLLTQIINQAIKALVLPVQMQNNYRRKRLSA